MGYLPTQSGDKPARPYTTLDLMDLAEAEGLAGVEFPLSALVPSFDGALVRVREEQAEVGAELKRRGLKLIADYGALLDNDAEHCARYLALAQKTGANV